MNEIYRAHRDKVAFLCVYIQEAHPEGGWEVLWNEEAGISIAQHETMEDRAEAAQVCMLKLNLEMPMVLDAIDNEVDRKYNALPERLYVIGPEGRVAFKTLAGSFGFDVEKWEEAIRKIAG